MTASTRNEIWNQGYTAGYHDRSQEKNFDPGAANPLDQNDEPMIADRINKLWDELTYAHNRVINGPTSDRRTLDAYRNGLLTAYAIIMDEPEKKIRERLMQNEVNR